MRQFAEANRKRLIPLTITKAKTKLNKSFVLQLIQSYMSQESLERVNSGKALFVFFEPVLAVSPADGGAQDVRRRGHSEQRAQREQTSDQGRLQPSAARSSARQHEQDPTVSDQESAAQSDEGRGPAVPLQRRGVPPAVRGLPGERVRPLDLDLWTSTSANACSSSRRSSPSSSTKPRAV